MPATMPKPSTSSASLIRRAKTALPSGGSVSGPRRSSKLSASIRTSKLAAKTCSRVGLISHSPTSVSSKSSAAPPRATSSAPHSSTGARGV